MKLVQQGERITVIESNINDVEFPKKILSAAIEAACEALNNGHVEDAYYPNYLRLPRAANDSK